MIKSKKLYIISNRLPISFSKIGDKVVMNTSSGGLVTAISSYIQYATAKGQDEFAEKVWVGVPGCSKGAWAETAPKHAGEYKYLPVFMNNQVYDKYYNGMSNSVIWPLFHYFPTYAEYNYEYYEQYMIANSSFMDALLQQVTEADVIWIHDYHLLPLAGMIRKHFPNITIGFFLHIPFPSYELFRLMPNTWQKSLLEGMLGADLVGFHTIDYASYFLKSVQRILGIANEKNIVKYGNRLVKADVFPISIDFKKYNTSFNEKRVAEIRDNYHSQFHGKKIIFSVDRLDYTKGVLCRLKGYEHFLKEYPQYLERVVFILSIVPSRDNIPKYIKRKKEIDEFIGSFNSKVGSISWKPVIYQYNHLEFENLCALYTASDVALITPLRDGMNLVAKEFVASRMDKKGVLILSEMTGAARELTDAIMINPNDTDGMAAFIKQGLEMDPKEQESRMSSMQGRIQEYDVNAWAEDYLVQLSLIKKKQTEFEFLFLGQQEKFQLVEKYRAASKRLILLDYDGTLVPFTPSPDSSKPDNNLLQILERLASDKHNDIYIISGRDSRTLEGWLGHLKINLIAEHGAKEKLRENVWVTHQIVERHDDWQLLIESIMQRYSKRCANTFIEKKEFSVVWHYRSADPGQAAIRSSELYAELSELAVQMNIQVVPGNKIIEVRVNGMDKGYITRDLVKRKKYDFIMACGDDNTDEDMFRVLTEVNNSYTLKIGDKASFANYNLYTPQMTVSLLELLSNSVNVIQEAE